MWFFDPNLSKRNGEGAFLFISTEFGGSLRDSANWRWEYTETTKKGSHFHHSCGRRSLKRFEDLKERCPLHSRSRHYILPTCVFWNNFSVPSFLGVSLLVKHQYIRTDLLLETYVG